jgi:hypothetical protein
VPVLEDPIPQLGELYPAPVPGANGAATFQGLFDAWGVPLPALEGALADLGPALTAMGTNLSSLDTGIGNALGELADSGLVEAQAALELELGQPNPVGRKFPFEFTVTQLPQPNAWTSNIVDQLRTWQQQFLNLLHSYLFITLPPG